MKCLVTAKNGKINCPGKSEYVENIELRPRYLCGKCYKYAKEQGFIYFDHFKKIKKGEKTK